MYRVSLSALFVTFVALVQQLSALVPGGHWAAVSKSVQHQSSLSAVPKTAEDRNPFGSKLMSDVSEDELQDLFKEFNITNFNLDTDPEVLKWQPSKEFFERYGFQNNTERYKRKTTDVKIDFYASYRKPILPQYKTFIADIMAMTFVQSMDSRYEYDALHAFGICTQYYTIMKGYALQDEVRLKNNCVYFVSRRKADTFLPCTSSLFFSPAS